MKGRALVVDDDRSMTKTLADVLELQGWEVSTAHTGAAAVQAAAQADFDVVIMDIRMPGMDGVDAFRAMKALRPGIRVVLMTAYAAPDRISQAEQEGVVQVMAKPIDISALLALLSETLSAQRPVLIIDHDSGFLKTLSDVLQLRGFEVVQAHSMAHATRLMAERRPIAVLLHVPSSAESARQAVAAMHELHPGVALILYSGQPGAADALEDALPHDWVHAYLQKPFAIDEITGVLNAIRTG